MEFGMSTVGDDAMLKYLPTPLHPPPLPSNPYDTYPAGGSKRSMTACGSRAADNLGSGHDRDHDQLLCCLRRRTARLIIM